MHAVGDGMVFGSHVMIGAGFGFKRGARPPRYRGAGIILRNFGWRACPSNPILARQVAHHPTPATPTPL